MRYMHANTKNEIQASKNFFVFEFFILIDYFNFLIKFLKIVCLDQSQRPHLFYKKKLQSLN